MRFIDFALMLLGSVVPWPRGASPLIASTRAPQGTPPTDYTIRTQPELLALFSDAIGPNGITPRSMRDFVASTVTTTPGGVPASIPIPVPGWTTATRPTGLVGPAIGYNYDLRQLDMWDDHLGTWVNPSFQGGTVAGATTFTGPVNFGALTVGGAVSFSGGVRITPLPISPAGLPSGQLWNNGLSVSVAP